MTDKPPQLGEGPSDRLAKVLRGVAGLAPYAGGAVSEIITHVIPGVRIKRIEEYLVWLTEKLQHLSEE